MAEQGQQASKINSRAIGSCPSILWLLSSQALRSKGGMRASTKVSRISLLVPRQDGGDGSYFPYRAHRLATTRGEALQTLIFGPD